MKHILIVEDDRSLNRGISFTMEKEGFAVSSAHSIREGQALLAEKDPDLLILDVNLPDGNGFDLCQRIRETSRVPIVFLTANDLELDMVMGFELGGDDYITKPFSLMVLKARVNALLRRSQPSTPQEMIFGNVRFALDAMKVFRDQKEVCMSVTEYKLALFLAKNAGKIMTKEQLLEALWDVDGQFVDGNTLAVNIRRLRTKLEENPSKPSTIKTVHGVGYVWTLTEGAG